MNHEQPQPSQKSNTSHLDMQPLDDGACMPYEDFIKNRPDLQERLTKEAYESANDEEFAQLVDSPDNARTTINPQGDLQSPDRPGRRRFLKTLAAGTLLTTGAGRTLWKKAQNPIEQNATSVDSQDPPKHTEQLFPPERKESGNMHTLREQLSHPEKPLDLTSAYKAEFQAYVKKLQKNPREYTALVDGVDRILSKNVRHLIAPFQKQHLPEALAWMVPLKESHFRNVTAQSGTRDAVGELQIRPSTARLFQKKYHLTPPFAHPGKSVYRDAELASIILRENYDIHGDINLALYAYNAGAGLFGYAKDTKKAERSQEGFLHYMEQKIHQKLTRDITERAGERVMPYTIKPGDTLDKIAHRMHTTRDTLKQINHMTTDKLIAGASLFVPVSRDNIIAHLIPKEYETLTYVPRMYAIQAILKRDGLDKKIISAAEKSAQTIARL